MPYAIEHRGDEWCVIKESDGKSMGCHASRNQALAQQRALYANEAQTAAVNETPPPIKLEFGSVQADVAPALIASIEAITNKIAAQDEVLRNVTAALTTIAETVAADRQELMAALTAAAQVPVPEAPVVNVHIPEQPAPVVHVPQQSAPDVHVTVEAAEQKQRKVVFERDPLTGQTISASLEEETEEPWLNA
jgi:hypothetical protein